MSELNVISRMTTKDVGYASRDLRMLVTRSSWWVGTIVSLYTGCVLRVLHLILKLHLHCRTSASDIFSKYISIYGGTQAQGSVLKCLT
jgi:hypothetical protein